MMNNIDFESLEETVIKITQDRDVKLLRKKNALK